MTSKTTLEKLLGKALTARQPMIDPEHQYAQRWFTGFYEGDPRLVVECFASTLLLSGYCSSSEESHELLDLAQVFYLKRFPWLTCVVQKQRLSKELTLKRGQVTFGVTPAAQILENGILHSVNLTLNQDPSFYLDTRNLRSWIKENSAEKAVLNAFAYTGSLGVAALAGGATRVLQVDLNARFLELARRSAMLNRLDLGRMKLRAVDVFSEIGKCKTEGQLFDLVILDPPFFSVTEKGKVDLESESARLINKLRPLIKDGGRLVSINNALFLSGADYLKSLETLCQDGYLEIEQLIAVPEEITGYPETIVGKPPVDPAPFNHPTKIAILRVRKK